MEVQQRARRRPRGVFAGKSNVIEGIFEKLKPLRPERLAEAG